MYFTACLKDIRQALKKSTTPKRALATRSRDPLWKLMHSLMYWRTHCAEVTDRGGVTSHAAIVSREIGIPCIIGTAVATSTLKDGAMVEVDTREGVVCPVDSGV